MFNIALNTFKEIIRNKFLFIIVVFAFLLILFSLSLGKLTLGDDEKIIVDFGISMIEIFGIIGVLFVGSQLLFREIEGKTIFLILSKPIKRYEFILGKFLGFAGIIFLMTLAQSLLYLGVLLFKGIVIDSLILFSLLFIVLKLFIVLALVLFFSTFISNILTIILSLLVYFIGHTFGVILDLVLRLKNTFLEIGVKILQIIFPPFEALNTKEFIGSLGTYGLDYYLVNTFYALAYLCIILSITILIFNKKKFEG